MPDGSHIVDLRACAPKPAREILPLEARDLTYQVGDLRLIDGLNLHFEGGGLSAVIGPNGAGKSLLLRLLHGLIAPSGGTVLWHGETADEGIRQRQAMVFQRPVLLRRSVAANLRYALRTARGQMTGAGLNGSGLNGSVETWLERANLLHLADRPARRLSGGEQQRLALARALSRRPEVLFLDEPTASLDPTATLAIEELIGQAKAEGTKVILVTHDLGQAKRLADEVLFLHRGKVEARAPTAQFFADPQSDIAAAFLAGRLVF